MATSGISFGTVQITTKGFRSYLYWYRNSVDPVANKSVLVIQLWHSTTSTGYTHEGQCYDTFIRWQGNYNYKGQFYIDCNPWTALGYGPDGYRAYLVYEIWVDVWHNADGSPPWMDVWGRFRTGTTYGPGDCYVNSSGYAWGFNDLDWIDRSGMTVTINPTNITTTSVNINRYWSDGANWCQYSINGSDWQNENTTYNGIYFGANNITGLQPNTEYTMKIRMQRSYNGIISESNTITFKTHPNTVTIINPQVTDITTGGCTLTMGSSDASVTDRSSYGIWSDDKTTRILPIGGNQDDTPALYSYNFISGLQPDTWYQARYDLRTVRSELWATNSPQWVRFKTHPTTAQVTNAIISNITQEGCSLSMGSTDSTNTMASSFAIYDSTKTTLILDGNTNNPAVYTKDYVSGLQPGTVYWAQFKLQTVRSEAWSDIVWVQFITIPALDDFCKFKYSDGTLSDAKPMFHIQDTNLCNPLKETYTYQGVTVTNNGDGTFTFNGTAIANVDLFISNSTATNTDTSDAIVTKAGDTYTLSREILGGTFTGSDLFYISLRKFDGSYVWNYLYAGSSSVKTTISEAGYLVGFRMYAIAGDVFNNYIIKPKITGCIKISKNKLKLIE